MSRHQDPIISRESAGPSVLAIEPITQRSKISDITCFFSEGGVGPMTVQMLMKNTIKTAVAQHFQGHKAQRALDEPCLCKDKDEEGQESHLL